MKFDLSHLLTLTAIGLLSVSVLNAQQPNHPELRYDAWSGSINVPDPVAVSVDNQGRVFVTQTRRRKIQDLDIRANSDWIPDDVGLQSVAEKRAFYRSRLAIGGTQAIQSLHVKDVNEDGQFDWRDLAVISEVIYRLTDDDGDGKADQIKVFDEDFKTEVTGIAAGVMAFNGDVYATVAPDVWRLTDTDDDGVADNRKIMATGFGLHIAYAGHDMHGLTVGPDGKVYWSIGDKGINVTSQEGVRYFYPNQGGVMRCNPDGSDFEVFAHGLRNVQEFAFDQYGNLFGVDNDADKPGERERFVAIVDGMDAGWRCNYQYRGDQYNPWMDEKLWELPGEQHPAYLVPPISHYVDGPAGFKFNPGTALGPAYKDYFFLTSAPNGSQYAFQAAKTGDSFAMLNDHQIGKGPAIVGLAFGPDGGLYGADWDGGYPLDQKGAVIRIDVDETHRNPMRKQVQEVLAKGFANLSIERLRQSLSHADMRIRQESQFELVKRQEDAVFESVLASPESDVLAKLHSVWGLGQLARAGNFDVVPHLIKAMMNESPQVRGQAAKTYSECKPSGGKPLIPLLSDVDLHVRVLAGLALARCPDPSATKPLLDAANQLKASEHYLRHSIVSALAACTTSRNLADTKSGDNEMQRLCCVLAIRRQASPLVGEFLDDKSAWVATEAARAVHDDLSIAAAMPQLATAISSPRERSKAFLMRSINANFRLGTIDCFERLLNLVGNDSDAKDIRLNACEALADWLSPPILDRVEGRWRDLRESSREINRERAEHVFAGLASGGVPSLQSASIRAARQLEVKLSQPALLTIFRSKKLKASVRVEAMRSIFDSPVHRKIKLCLEAIGSRSEDIQLLGIELLEKHYPLSAVEPIQIAFAETKFLKVRQACLRSIGRLGEPKGDAWLAELASRLVEGSGDTNLALDVMESLENAIKLSTQNPSGNDSATRLSLEESVRNVHDSALKRSGNAAKNAKFVFSRDGGDSGNGKQIFNTNVSAQCVRCHRVGKTGSDIGPELTKIAKQRDPDHLLRAIVSPSTDIEPKYKTTAFLLASGQVVSGVVQSETDTKVVIADSNGKLLKVDVDEIEDESDQKVSLMPEMHDVLSASQVRDLVAYLRTLK